MKNDRPGCHGRSNSIRPEPRRVGGGSQGPAGSVAELDGCSAATVGVTFEFDPDAPPAVSSLSLELRLGEAAADCVLFTAGQKRPGCAGEK